MAEEQASSLSLASLGEVSPEAIAMGLSFEDEQRIIKVQKVFRGLMARRRGAAIAGEVYKKCYDYASGFAYYYNQKTGGASWDKPKLLGSNDVDWFISNEEAQLYASSYLSDDTSSYWNDPSLTDNNELSNQELDEESQAQAQIIQERMENSSQSAGYLEALEKAKRKLEEGTAFKLKCEQEKKKLQRQFRRKILRSMQEWDKKMMQNKRAARDQRLLQLKMENKKRHDDLFEGRESVNHQTIREASMRGNVERIKELLEKGFSPNAESAMGLTPLYAACQGGHYDAVRVLLENGANVNHANVKNGRTGLMEASLRPKGDIVKELLRYGARIDVKDYQGENARGSAKDPCIKKLLDLASKKWSEENAALFPIEFRQVTLSFAFIAKKQHEAYLKRKATIKKELNLLKQKLQRTYIEAKVKYDEDLKFANGQITIFKRIDAVENADTKYDQERGRILCTLHDAWKSFLQADHTTFLTEKIIFHILGFCGRHWFERNRDPTGPGISTSSSNTIHKRRHKRKNNMTLLHIQPTRLCPSPDELPMELTQEWEVCLQTIERCRTELKEAEAKEKVDVETGVARDLQGKSVAFLDITVVQAENLPLRSLHTQDLIDPLVRIFLRPENGEPFLAKSEYEEQWEFFTEPRLADINPIWDTPFQLYGLPATKREIGVQVIDNLRSEVAGEISIPLRSLLDQKEHDTWFILPPTLRQQVMEQKNPRKVPARIRLLLKLIHSRSIVLTRELQQQGKAREVILRKRRDYIQGIFQSYLNRISSK